MRLAVVAVLALIGCKHAKSHGKFASRAECEQYAAKLLAIADPATREAATKLGRDKPSEQDLALCTERMTSEEVGCALAASTTAGALACKPSWDPRPAALRYTDDECAGYAKHLGELVGDPKLAASFALAGKRECEHWLTGERFACVGKATTLDQLAHCPP